MASLSPRHGGMEGGIVDASPSYPTRQALRQKESFGSVANINIPIALTMIHLVIGKKGRNAKRICGETGLVYLTVAYTAIDSNRRARQDVLIMEGSLNSIIAAVHVVRRILDPEGMQQSPVQDVIDHHQFRHKKYKTKLCSRFSRGFCQYDKLCQFAHGKEELIIDK